MQGVLRASISGRLRGLMASNAYFVSYLAVEAGQLRLNQPEIERELQRTEDYKRKKKMYYNVVPAR